MANADQYLRMTKRAAQNKAESDSLIFRLISVGKEQFLPYPDDKREDRICIEIDEGGLISKATIQ